MKYGLNLGCGTRIFKSNADIEWTNLDAIAGPGVDVVADWRYLPFMVQASDKIEYDIIIAHHTLEHQGCGEQPIALCYAILKPGGSLIVSVPDVRKLAEMWLRGQISTQVYLTNIYGPFDGTEESRHKWGFDAASLQEALTASAPWASVKQFDWRHIPGTEIARDDNWILCVEAVK